MKQQGGRSANGATKDGGKSWEVGGEQAASRVSYRCGPTVNRRASVPLARLPVLLCLLSACCEREYRRVLRVGNVRFASCHVSDSRLVRVSVVLLGRRPRGNLFVLTRIGDRS